MQAATAAAPAKGSIFDPTGGRPVHPSFRRQSEPSAPSPTQITFQLKALGDPFEDFLAIADRVGLRHPMRRGDICQLGLVSHDTQALIASVHYHQWDHLEHRLKVVEFRIDPENCEPELDAGWRLFDHLKALAKALNAAICDEVGSPLDAMTCKALADHIDGVMKRRIDTAWNKLAVKLPDGSLRFPGTVSFETVTYEKKPGKPRSRTATRNHFDVPALPYSAAHAKAYRMVEELRRVFDEHKSERPYFPYMLADALGVPPPELNWTASEKPARENVVAVFLGILHRVLDIGLANTNPKWLAEQAALYEGYAERDARHLSDGRKAFTERMRAAKAAKKARAEGGAA